LVPRFYVADDIVSGILAAPFAEGLPDEKRFCVVYPDYKQDFRPLRLFLDWVVEEAQRFRVARENTMAPYRVAAQ
jgi:LysR family glycine cleavage system transcriptional activator